MIELLETFAIILQIALVPMFVVCICFALDSYVNLRYFLWNLEDRKKTNATDLAESEPAINAFEDDCK